MPSVAISALTLSDAPPADTDFPAKQGSGTVNPRIRRTGLLFLLGRLDEITVAPAASLALTYALHQGRMVILGGAASAFTLNATTEGTGFSCEIANRTGTAYTVPAITGATLNMTTGHTKISIAGRATLTLYTHSGTIYASVRGDTEA